MAEEGIDRFTRRWNEKEAKLSVNYQHLRFNNSDKVFCSGFGSTPHIQMLLDQTLHFRSVNHLPSKGHVIVLWWFAAANDPCDKVRVIGTRLTTAKKNQYQLHLYRRIVKSKCPGVPVSPASASHTAGSKSDGEKKKRTFIVVSNWALTLMLTTSLENRRPIR